MKKNKEINNLFLIGGSSLFLLFIFLMFFFNIINVGNFGEPFKNLASLSSGKSTGSTAGDGCGSDHAPGCEDGKCHENNSNPKDACVGGKFKNVKDEPGQKNWSCEGINGGETISCSIDCDTEDTPESRKDIEKYDNISINKPEPPKNNPKNGTSLDGMPENAMELIKCLSNKLSEEQDKAGLPANDETKDGLERPDLVVTGGTEPGHATHGVCKPRFDLRLDPQLNKWITENAVSEKKVGNGTEYTMKNGVKLTREKTGSHPKFKPHWHADMSGASGSGNLCE
jgi:hypothetical protein